MPSELLDLARAIALEAGELAAQRRREGVEVAATKSSIVDVVTEADREVERLIRGRILDARPDDAVLAKRTARHPAPAGSPGASTRSTARSTTCTASRTTRSASRSSKGSPIR